LKEEGSSATDASNGFNGCKEEGKELILTVKYSTDLFLLIQNALPNFHPSVTSVKSVTQPVAELPSIRYIR